MKWSTVAYERSFRVAQYETEKFSIEFIAEESGAEKMIGDEALYAASEFVNSAHQHLVNARVAMAPEVQHTPALSTGAPIPAVGGWAAKPPSQPQPQNRPPPPQSRPPAPYRPPQVQTQPPQNGQASDNWYDELKARPYAIALPFPKGASFDVEQAKEYIKALGYRFHGKKDGGNNWWYGEIFPDQIPDLVKCLVKFPPDTATTQNDYAGDTIPEWK
jgi:hypothetical protein